MCHVVINKVTIHTMWICFCLSWYLCHITEVFTDQCVVALFSCSLHLHKCLVHYHFYKKIEYIHSCEVESVSS